MGEHRENIYLANMAYLAYGQVTDHKNFRGEPMPDFDDLPDKIRSAWVNAVKAVRRRVVKNGMTAEAEAETIEQKKPRVRFCWSCGRKLRGNHFVEKEIDGHKRILHKTCAETFDKPLPHDWCLTAEDDGYDEHPDGYSDYRTWQ